MTVDGQESPTVTAVGDGTMLDVEGKLYLGGLPSEYRARNIGNVSSVFCTEPILPLLWLCFYLFSFVKENVKLSCLSLGLGCMIQTF